MAEVQPRFEAASAVACGGVLTALPALLESGLIRHAAPGLPKGYYGAATMLLFLCFLFLARLRAPEHLRFEAPGEWGALLGLDRCPEVKTLRRKLRAFSSDEQAVGAWQAALARDWAARDPELAASLCVDGHVKVYAGRKGHLPRHFVSRQKLCLPAATSYWIHALDGAPFLCLHQEVDPGMVRILRETILPELREMGVLPAEADPAAPALTLVFDREGWSPALFRHLACCGIACITWRKGRKQPDWPADEFSQDAVPLHGPGGMREAPAPLAERTVTLPNGLTVREIRRLTASGHQAPEMGDGPEPEEADKPAGEAPDEAKSKTQRWVRGLRDSRELVRGLDGVRAIAVMDREGDAFEIFDEQRRFDGDIALLVRARHNRSLGKGKRKLLDRMRAQPARADVMVPVKASAGRGARKASCAVRWATLAVPPPAEELAQFGREPVRLSAVHVAESEAPADGAEPLEWLLLTTLPVGNREQALEVVGFYLLRWRIEDWHRILKTGCEVEKISHRTASRIQRAVAIKAVIAWRLAVFALLGTETPELDAGLLFSEHEIAILEDYARERRVQGPDNLGRAVLLLSMMGGYLNRKHDAPPGHQIVWEGYARLALGARVVERAQKFGSDSSVFRKLTSG